MTTTPTQAVAYDHDTTQKMLNTLYDNCHMASQSIMTLNKYIDKDPLDKIMHTMTNRYNNYIGDVNNLAHQLKCSLKSTTGWSQMMANMSIKWQMITDKCCSHAIKILIQGVFMGILDLQTQLNNSVDINQDVATLAREILHYHQQSIEQLKEYL